MEKDEESKQLESEEDFKLDNRQSGNNSYQAPQDPQWGDHSQSYQGDSDSTQFTQLNPLGVTKLTNNNYKLDDNEIDETEKSMEFRNK